MLSGIVAKEDYSCYRLAFFTHQHQVFQSVRMNHFPLLWVSRKILAALTADASRHGQQPAAPGHAGFPIEQQHAELKGQCVAGPVLCNVGEAMHLLVDITGLKLSGEGE